MNSTLTEKGIAFRKKKIREEQDAWIERYSQMYSVDLQTDARLGTPIIGMTNKFRGLK